MTPISPVCVGLLRYFLSVIVVAGLRAACGNTTNPDTQWTDLWAKITAH